MPDRVCEAALAPCLLAAEERKAVLRLWAVTPGGGGLECFCSVDKERVVRKQAPRWVPRYRAEQGLT